MQKNLPASFFYYKFIEVNITVQQAIVAQLSRQKSKIFIMN